MRAIVTLALAVVLSAISTEGCIHACKKFTETSIPGCTLKGDGCECLLAEDAAAALAQPKSALMPDHHHHHHGHKYKVTLTDPTTGVSGSSGYVHGKSTAGDDAVYQLFNTDRGCNCQSKSVPSGKCTVEGKGCFFFQSSADVASQTTAFQLYAQVTAPKKSSQFTAIAANKAGIEAAALQLVTKIAAFDPSCTPTAAEAKALAELHP